MANFRGSSAGSRRVLPGFGITLGLTLFYLSVIVLVPLVALFAKAASLSFGELVAILTDERVAASLRLSLGAALAGASINVVFGCVVAWTLERHRFPGARVLDALVDLPFALPTAVTGIALTTLLAKNGWIGAHLSSLGIDVAFTPLGIIVALTFIGLPFVVRTVQPAIADLPHELEEAAASLGASRAKVLLRVVLPALLPAILTGFSLAFARAVGEYGSVIFISGNMPMRTEIAPLLIVTKLEQYDYAGATAVAALLLVLSFAVLLAVKGLEWWNTRAAGAN